MMQFLFAVVLVATSFSGLFGNTCEKPRVTPEVYVSSELVISSAVNVIAEFSLKCANSPQALTLLAEFDGEMFPVSKSLDGSVHQITITKDVNAFAIGKHSINVYDDASAALIRKAQQLSTDGGSKHNVPATFKINFEYKGSYKGLLVPSEVVALGVGLTFSVLAFHARSSLSN